LYLNTNLAKKAKNSAEIEAQLLDMDFPNNSKLKEFSDILYNKLGDKSVTTISVNNELSRNMKKMR
jgi:hypothetical protein